ncbi:response regulator [Paenibacillus sp. CC-CFT747]|nr:response regulator [Paenibacillus sp. CC-CFT747]
MYRAYSAPEALALIESIKIHIVLTDIHMPGMDGLELQSRIARLWPRCKVIFLTGYNDFEYAQQAIRNGAFDFILKIEDDDAILASINKATNALKGEMVIDQYMYKAEQQLKAARPALQKEYLWNLLQGELPAYHVHEERFRELGLPLDPHEEVLLVTGRVDRWTEGISSSDKTLLMYAVENIASEFMAETRHAFCSYQFQPWAWFIQASPAENSGHPVDWAACMTRVLGSLSDIQTACEQLLKLPLSLAVGKAPCPWSRVPVTYLQAQRKLWRGLGVGKELVIQEVGGDDSAAESPVREDKTRQELILHVRKAGRLQDHLESGQREEFYRVLGEVAEFAHTLMGIKEGKPLLVELQLALCAVHLSYLNQTDMFSEVSPHYNLAPLIGQASFRSWEEAELYFARLAELLFSLKGSEQKDRTGRIITAVHDYIEAHLHDNLSLDVLAEHVYLHPAYLSRLYKQAAGQRLSDYIKSVRIKKAKELLTDDRLKIHEVAARVGFETSYYFSKVFKKEMKVTPQEYRDRLAK